MPAPAPARVFISYSSKNTNLVTRLRDDLKRAGVDVWLDHERLTAGTPNWQAAVRRGIEQATDVIYAASPDAADSQYVGHELAIARDEEKRILPFWVQGEKWSRCTPMGYYYAQYTDGRSAAYSAGLAALLKALGVSVSDAPRPIATQAASARVDTIAPAPRPAPPPIPPERFPARLATLGFTPHARNGVEWIVPPLCHVPAGQFRLGSDKKRDSLAQDDELKRRVVDLPAFEIARFPVTVAEYACFVNATKRTPPQKRIFNDLTWEKQLQRLDHPVGNISWTDADNYADWLVQRTSQPWRLPTEAEWEKAARCDPRDPQGPLGASSERIYPWGDSFDKLRCNTLESGIKTTSPVGWYGPDDPDPRAGRKSGASPCGAEGMAGNVWEWTATESTGDYSKSELSSQCNSTDNRCLRGGSWADVAGGARAAYRVRDRPDDVYDDIGFRLVRVPPGSFH